MGIQMQICSILRFSWSILAKCCAHLRTSSSKTQMLLLERLYFSNTDCFVRDSSCLHLTFVAFCLLSVICKQYLKQCNYSVDQSALLTGFRTDFTTSVWIFCRWVPDRFLLAKRPLWRRVRRNGCFRRLIIILWKIASSLIHVNTHYELIQFAFSSTPTKWNCQVHGERPQFPTNFGNPLSL